MNKEPNFGHPVRFVKDVFKNASQSFRDKNKHLGLLPCDKKPLSGNVGRSTATLLGMNKTEAEFAGRLEAMRVSGEILRWQYEGITLRWSGLRYTPDFVVFLNPACDWKGQPTIKFIEVKGAWTGGKFERAIERFRHARTYWPEFAFELHQKTKQGWKRVY